MAAREACQSWMNDWCTQNCPHAATHGPLFALHDRSSRGEKFAWRCYASTTLNDAGTRYLAGETYCTRQLQLEQVLERCLRDQQWVHQVQQQQQPQDKWQAHTAVRYAQRQEQLARLPAMGVSVDLLGGTSPHPAATHGALSEADSVPALQPWPSSTGVLTLKAVDSTSWRSTAEQELLRVHSWSVDCIDTVERHKLNNYTGNVSRKKAFLKREGLSCYGRCIRGVVDGFATHEEIDELKHHSIVPAVAAGQTSNIRTWRWDVPTSPPVFRMLVKRAETVMEEQFGVRNLRFYRSNVITWRHRNREPLRSPNGELKAPNS